VDRLPDDLESFLQLADALQDDGLLFGERALVEPAETNDPVLLFLDLLFQICRLRIEEGGSVLCLALPEAQVLLDEEIGDSIGSCGGLLPVLRREGDREHGATGDADRQVLAGLPDQLHFRDRGLFRRVQVELVDDQP